MPFAGPRLLVAARVVHPFPSVLDGVLVGVVATVAGAPPSTALLLGVSMTLLQFAIGTLNDAADAPRDVNRPGKPVALGIISVRAAQRLALAFAAAGLLLAIAAGPLLLFPIALGGLAIGVWYDLAAKGTRLSWLPFALGVPLLPVYAWYGAAGTLPTAFAILVPMAVLAGAALAMANALVDVERDVAGGVTSLAASLGPRRAALVVLVLQLAVGTVATETAYLMGAAGMWLTAVAGASCVPVAGAALGLVVARRGPSGREVAFELQAVGLALLAVAWVNAVGARL